MIQLINQDIIIHAASIWKIATKEKLNHGYGVRYEILDCFRELSEACIYNKNAMQLITSKRNNDNDTNDEDRYATDLHAMIEIIGQIVEIGRDDRFDSDTLTTMTNFCISMDMDDEKNNTVNVNKVNNNDYDYGAVTNDQGMNVFIFGCQSIVSIFDHYIYMVWTRYGTDGVNYDISGSGIPMKTIEEYETNAVIDCGSTLAKILDASVHYSNDTVLMDKMKNTIVNMVDRVCYYHLRLHWTDEWKQLKDDSKTNQESVAYILGLDKCKKSDSIEFIQNLVKPLQSMKNIEWKIIRLIWMGYEKNVIDDQNKNNQCYICLLPKDIVLWIISFLTNNRIRRLLKLYKC